ncbi:MAG: serine hydrolase [Quinella sp. 3Q1]|nr:serine hydrolase [Quinella sp. 3Q1]
MRSASMIKVFILAAAMDKAKNGELNLDETLTLKSSDKVGGAGILAGYSSGTVLTLREVIELMITHSDNTATNMIIDRLGMSMINEYIRREGYGDTVLRRKMMDYDAIYAGRENFSSVKDLGDFFNRLYNYECVGEEYDKIMLDFLVKQTDTDCFPAALPDKQIAHKTGALDGLYDNGGIIYSDAGDAVLVIMTENFTGEYNTIQHMKAFARAVVQ